MKRFLFVPVFVVLAACQVDTAGFGGSGGSGGGSGGSAGLQLARDACVRAVEERGQRYVSVESIVETSGGATGMLTSRRDPMTVSAQRWRCSFSYTTGRASVRRA
jgi:hypothetical protein